MPRLQILTPAEATAFETPPVFSLTEREKFFHIPASLAPLLATQRTVTNQVCLVLTVGYFRATKRFFPRAFHPTDIEYVARHLGCLPGLIDVKAYDEKATTSRHRKLTLDYLGFRPFNAQAQEGMAQDKGDSFLGTEVRQPIPGENAFDRDAELVAVRGDDAQKRPGRGGQILVDQNRPALIEDTDVHRPRM